ncbi:MAG: AMP-binding protein [Candidatus Omnitrophica bacterium]|nr:AMP-binding protein [Candidatus Omnitrophota bacterium]
MKTIVEIFSEATEKFKDRVGIQMVSDGEKEAIFYAQIRLKVEKIIWRLKNWGIEKGTPIGILSENRPEWVYAYFAILSAGGVVVGIDINLKPQEILFILQHAEIKIIFVSKNNLPIISEMDKSSLLEKIICFDDGEGDGICRLSDILKEDFAFLPSTEVSVDDLAMLVYTSGTTGNPKAVMLSHRNITSNIKMIRKIFQWDWRDNFLSLLPLSHMFELTCGLLAPFSSGAKITYISSLRPDYILDTMKDEKVTFVMVVPGILRLIRMEILKHIKQISLKKKLIFYLCFGICAVFRLFNLNLGKIMFKKIHERFGRSLKFFVSGGAPLSPFIIWWFDVLGITILQGYGLTEASPVISVNTPLENRIGSVGKPLPGIEVRIENDFATGEVLVRGENVMLGYYKNTQESKSALRDNWLYTGDIGRIDSHGFLYILGREKNVIVLESGLKVYPEELEEELLKKPAIREVCVIGKREFGYPEEKVYALIVPHEEYLGLTLDKDLDKIREFLEKEVKALNERLAAYKHIRGFEIRKDLPKTATRKIKKELVKNTL